MAIERQSSHVENNVAVLDDSHSQERNLARIQSRSVSGRETIMRCTLRGLLQVNAVGGTQRLVESINCALAYMYREKHLTKRLLIVYNM